MNRPTGRADASRCAAHPAQGQARIRLYRMGVLEAEGFPSPRSVTTSSTTTSPSGSICTTRGATDLAVLTDEVGLYPLAVEDAVLRHERDPTTGSSRPAPRAPRRERAGQQLAAFFTPRALITVCKDPSSDVDRRSVRPGGAGAQPGDRVSDRHPEPRRARPVNWCASAGPTRSPPRVWGNDGTRATSRSPSVRFRVESRDG